MPKPTKTTIAPVAAIVAPIAPVAVKPAAKPSASDNANANRERCLANRAIVVPHYNGASLATHRSAPPKLADALARVADPIQRAKSATPRDESALALAFKHSDAAGTFCPVAATADLGALSRLASLGHLAVSGQRIALTPSGLSLAKLIAKRA